MNKGKLILTSAHSPFIPILKSLATEGHGFATIQPPFAQQLQHLELPAKSLAELSDPSIQSNAFNEAARLLKTVSPPRNSLGPGALDFMQNGLPGFLYPRLADITSFILILDKIKPALVLLHNDVEPLTRAAALWAKERGAPCLHVPHAIYLDIEKGQPGDDIHDLVTASHLAVGGWFQREWYEMRGFGSRVSGLSSKPQPLTPRPRIFDTGLPQFDPIATLPLSKARARIQLGLDQQRPVVVYASSWRQDTNLLGCHDGPQETYLAVLEAIRRLPEVQFVIKLHPHATDAQWHAQAAQQAGIYCHITAMHLEACLQASDVVMSYSGSNLLLEASFVPWTRLVATQGYENDPEVLKVSTDPPDPALIVAAITRALQMTPPDYRALQAKYLGRVDGLAGVRITEVIKGLLG